MEEGLEGLLKIAGMLAGAGLEMTGHALDTIGETMDSNGDDHGNWLKVVGKAAEFLGRELGENCKE